MTLLARIRYAAYLAVVVGAAISLALILGSADAIALLPRRAFDWAFSPPLMITIYVISFIIAPWVAAKLPIKRWEAPRASTRLPLCH